MLTMQHFIDILKILNRKDTMSILSNNIKQTRLARGLSQDEVAEVIGLTRPTYSLIESGKKDLTLPQAEALSAILRISLDDLRGGPDSISAIADPNKSLEKYKQIILNALSFGSDGDGRITKTKLAKLVYLADFIWYYENSTPMSGMSYRKLPQGPVPDIYFRALDELEEDGIIDREQKGNAILYSLIEPNAPEDKLSESELKMIHAISESWKGKNTKDIVNFTHDQLPWQICRDGEIIPYGLITQEEQEKVYGPELCSRIQ